MEELSTEEETELLSLLAELESELQQLLESTKEGARPVDLDTPIGRLSRMDAMQQQAMVLANRSAHELRLRQVRRALKKAEDGEYGACLRCEEPIGIARLRARPEAHFCRGCQESADP